MKKYVVVIWAVLCCTSCEMFSILSSPTQERGVGGFFLDNVVRLKVNAILASGKGLEQVEILIHQGRILLLGIVNESKTKRIAVEEVRKIEGVKEVVDEMRVGHETMADYSRDAWLGHKLRALLFFDERILSQNYHIRVVNKIVYILGTAQNAQEKDFVMRHAESLPVRRVVSYIRFSTKRNQNAASIL